MTKGQLQARRLAAQTQHFRDFEQCPSCFAKQIQGGDRMFLFDAVVDCGTTLRVGTWRDGGKWLCNPDQLPSAAVVYSFGAGDEISFDQEMATTFGANVYLFDPTPSLSRKYESLKAGQARGRGRIFFHAMGLGPVSPEPGEAWALTLEGQRCPVASLGDIARTIGHDHVDILKIDIEGAEFAALQLMLAKNTLTRLHVQQVLVEFHLWSDRAFGDFVDVVRRLADQGYLLFRKELNPTDATRCAELAFVHKSRIR
jgi:FkbM family methyltransferase